MLTERERAELERLQEIERAEQAAEAARRDALVAADRGRDWSAGPPVPPRPPRVAVPYAIGPHRGEFLVDCAKTPDELIEENYERDPATGEWRRW